MKRYRAIILALVVSACTQGDAKTSLSVPVIDTLPNGVVQVTNSGPTAWADTNGWRLVEEPSIVPEEGSPGELSNPRTVVADRAGNIYMMQSKPTLIKVYAPDGTWLRNIGREGDGPGEYRDGMFGILRDTLFVQDPNNTRMTTFTTNGAFIATHHSQCCYWTSQFPTFEDGTVGIMGPSEAEDDQGAIYLTRLDGTVTDTVHIPSSPQDTKGSWTVRRRTANSSSMMGVSIPLQPSDQMAWSSDRHEIVGNTRSYQLVIRKLQSDTIRIFTATAPTLTISNTERDSIFEAEIEGVNEMWRAALREVASADQIPNTWPAWSGVAVDAARRIWVGRPGSKGAVSVLDVFSSDGILLGSVPAPSPGILDGYWTSDHVYLLGETEEGFPRVRVFRIETILP